MTEPDSIVRELLQAFAASATLTAAAWGVAGGATAALAVSGVGYRAALRLVVLGGLCAGGLGGAGGAIVAYWLGLDATLIPLMAGGGTLSYLSGVFGPSIIEVILSRIRRGRLPTEDEGR